MAAARLTVPAAEPRDAHAAGLRYVDESAMQLRRVRAGRGFRVVDAEGRAVDPATLARVKALVLPPAWTDVRICVYADGHLQATGRDARGRKQYRYHARWREVRDGTKYARAAAFGRALPAIRRRVARDLSLPGLPKEKVVAVVVRLLERTGARVGNEAYARDNGSFGLTTLRNRHADVGRDVVELRFRGKSAKAHAFRVHDPRLARVVARCQALPGQFLFQYEAGERVGTVTSDDVNAWLKDATGEAFTAKDFRTWRGTLLIARTLSRVDPPRSPTEAKRVVARAIAKTASRLGNTPAVCRRAYIHPAVIEAYSAGRLPPSIDDKALLHLLEARHKEGSVYQGAPLPQGRER